MLFKRVLSLALSLSLGLPPLAYASEPTMFFTYDDAGRLQDVTTSGNRTTSFEYDPLGRVATVVHPDDGVELRRYNGQDVLRQVVTPRNLTWNYAISGFAEQEAEYSPDSGATTQTWTPSGQPWRTYRPDGFVLTRAYDALDRPVSYGHSTASTIHYGFDEGALANTRQLTSMIDASGSTSWDYDVHGNVISKIQVQDTVTLATAYEWDAGHLSGMTYPSGRQVEFIRVRGKVTSIEVDGLPLITDVQYHPAGGVQSWDRGPSAGVFTRAFDTAGRLTSWMHPGGERTLAWGDDNLLTSVSVPQGVIASYEYDDNGRLTRELTATSDQGYSYDVNGNRTGTSVNGTPYPYAVSWASNRLISAATPSGTHSYQYNANGEITSDGIRVVLRWNPFGQVRESVSQGVTTQYAYNGLGNRVQKLVVADVSKTRHYVYAEDDLSLIGEYGPTGEALTETVWLEGIPVLVMTPTAIYHVVPGHLNEPRALLSNNGTVVWQWDSDAFGVGQASGVLAYNLRFPGQQYDVETGLHYNNARYYDPITGRYRSSDPLGLLGGFGTYTYANGNPLSFVDPEGELPLPVVTGLVGAAANTAATLFWQIADPDQRIHAGKLGVAAGVGFVQGFLAPTTAGSSWLGSRAIGTLANVGQTIGSSWAECGNYNSDGLAMGQAFITGAIGGGMTRFVKPRLDPSKAALLQMPLTQRAIREATAVPTLLRSVVSSTLTNTPALLTQGLSQ